MPTNTSPSEDLVDTQAPEPADQALTDEEVAAAAGGISGKTRSGPQVVYGPDGSDPHGSSGA
jgi:hypothetical protein